MSQKFDVYDAEEGTCRNAVVIIGKNNCEALWVTQYDRKNISLEPKILSIIWLACFLNMTIVLLQDVM